MSAKLSYAAAMLLATSTHARCAEQAASPVPSSVMALAGCWEGSGNVMGKPVAIAVNAYPIVQDAMLAVEAVSSAIADPQDQYSAHLVFGENGQQAGTKADQIVGYWADSFGGAFAASGRGAGSADGIEVAYQYGDSSFVNRWRILEDHLTWQITARAKNGGEKPFANYALRKGSCES